MSGSHRGVVCDRGKAGPRWDLPHWSEWLLRLPCLLQSCERLRYGGQWCESRVLSQGGAVPCRESSRTVLFDIPRHPLTFSKDSRQNVVRLSRRNEHDLI
jgi:hypothetical protein